MGDIVSAAKHVAKSLGEDDALVIDGLCEAHDAWLKQLNEAGEEISTLNCQLDRREQFCQEFIWGEDNPHEYQTLQEERDVLAAKNEKLEQAVRLAFSWAKKKEHWQQSRDVLANQMFEMGEL